MEDKTTKSTSENDKDNTQNCPIEYFCEVCGHYPLIPMHGHFECPECKYKTKCCEGI